VFDVGDDGGGIDTQYFTDLPTSTGESTLVIIEDSEGLDPGDEIGVFDMSGVLETVDFGATPDYGELLVGSAVWTDDQTEISAVMSIDLSDFNGPVLNGAVDGNTVFYKVWKADEDAVYMAEAEYSVGNGTFGELFLSISLLSPIFSVEQSIELMPYLMNSLSFNVQLEDPSVESCFEGIDVLLASNDAQGFYVPQNSFQQMDPLTEH
jgi:hypothetical protein